jgi:hypothetical protein
MEFEKPKIEKLVMEFEKPKIEKLVVEPEICSYGPEDPSCSWGKCCYKE